MNRIQYRWLLVLFAILPTSLLSGAIEEAPRIKGESASPVINLSGDMVWFFKNQRGGLSEVWQDPSSGKYAVKEVLSNSNVSAPVSKIDRQGNIWAIWEEGTENNNAIVFTKIGGKTGISPGIVSPLKGYHFSPDFCFDSANIAWLTWVHYTEGRFQLWVKEMKT